MTQPHCKNCGKKIPKWITCTHLRSEEQAGRGVGGSDWLTVPQLPRNRAEAQRYVNGQITKLYNWGDDGQITMINHWNGESYDFRHGHFCTVDCAARFGRHMADNGWTRA